MTTSTDQREAVDFVVELFGENWPDGIRPAVWTLGSKRTDYLDSPADAARFEDGTDVYIHAALVGGGVPKGKRPAAEHAAGIPGVWADLDVVGGPKDKPGKLLAPSVEEAFEVASSILAPTVLVHSGYGVQAWWLFDEPWIFDGDSERSKAAEIAKGWVDALRTKALDRGWGIDSVGDLARLMRLPGTYNGKGEDEARVETRSDDGPRHAMESIAEHAMGSAPAVLPSTNGEVAAQVEPQMDRRKFEALRDNHDKFEATWEHRRKISDGSMSGFDLALASIAAHAGWSDAEIAGLIVAHRNHHGDPDGKAQRVDYLERTIAKARVGVDAAPSAEGSASPEPAGPVLIDPKTGKELTALQELNREIESQSGTAEIVSVKQVGQQDAQWYFTVRNQQTGEAVELKSLETRKLEVFSNLAARVREAGGGTMPRPRAGNEKHTALMDAIDAAKEMHETGGSEASTWQRRLARYVETKALTSRHSLTVRDLSDPDQKRAAIENPFPFEDVDGHLQINAGNWLAYLEDRRTKDVTEAAVLSALRHLGFERQEQLSAKFDKATGTRRFWRAPAGFDWRADG